jgi:hypothetical protein
MLAETEPIGLQFVNLDKRTARSLQVAAFPDASSWIGSSEKVLANIKVAGERPNTLVIIDVVTGKERSFTAPWENDLNRSRRYHGITSQLASGVGDFAITFWENEKRADIILYSRVGNKLSWHRAGVIRSQISSSGEVVAHPMIVNWLSNGRLAYAMLYQKQERSSTALVELWTCKRDGTDQKKWVVLSGASPPSYNAIGLGWLTVSANGKRIAFFRNDKAFMYDAKELFTAVGPSPE